MSSVLAYILRNKMNEEFSELNENETKNWKIKHESVESTNRQKLKILSKSTQKIWLWKITEQKKRKNRS